MQELYGTPNSDKTFNNDKTELEPTTNTQNSTKNRNIIAKKESKEYIKINKFNEDGILSIYINSNI